MKAMDLRLTIAFTKVRVGHSQTHSMKMKRIVIMTMNMRRMRTKKLTIPCQTAEH